MGDQPNTKPIEGPLARLWGHWLLVVHAMIGHDGLHLPASLHAAPFVIPPCRPVAACTGQPRLPYCMLLLLLPLLLLVVINVGIEHASGYHWSLSRAHAQRPVM